MFVKYKLSRKIGNNYHVLVGGKPAFFKEFYECGIKYIRVLFVCDNAQDSFKCWVNKGLKHTYTVVWSSIIKRCCPQ